MSGWRRASYEMYAPPGSKNENLRLGMQVYSDLKLGGRKEREVLVVTSLTG